MISCTTTATHLLSIGGFRRLQEHLLEGTKPKFRSGGTKSRKNRENVEYLKKIAKIWSFWGPKGTILSFGGDHGPFDPFLDSPVFHSQYRKMSIYKEAKLAKIYHQSQTSILKGALQKAIQNVATNLVCHERRRVNQCCGGSKQK